MEVEKRRGRGERRWEEVEEWRVMKSGGEERREAAHDSPADERGKISQKEERKFLQRFEVEFRDFSKPCYLPKPCSHTHTHTHTSWNTSTQTC